MPKVTQAIKVLKKGGVVVYPTDTAYGLAVDATNPKAVEQLYRLKGRDFRKPTHVIVPEKIVDQIVKIDSHAKKLIKKFWPGPLTLVLPLLAKGKSWQKLSAGSKTMGIRYPDHEIARILVETFGKPITTTSANLSGNDNCYSLSEVKKQFKNKKKQPDFYLNGGKLRKKLTSTVVLLIDGVTILRAGPITETQIKNVITSKNKLLLAHSKP